MMARYWNLPDDFANLIENHTEIEKIIGQSREAPDRVAVAMSAMLPSISDTVWAEFQQFESFYKIIVPAKGPTIEDAMKKVDDEFDQFAPLMKLGKPAKSLVDRYREATPLVTQ
jgi:hypothetical protein